MVLDIFKYITDSIKSDNPYLTDLIPNGIKLKDGNVVNFIGSEKTNIGVNDIWGTAGYIRITSPIEYKESKKQKISCKTDLDASINFNLVIYQVDVVNNKIHPFKVENRIVGQLTGMDFSLYTGKEKNIGIMVNKSELDNESNFKNELSVDKDSGSDVQIIVISGTLTWSFAMDDCGEQCDVYNLNEC